MNNNFNKWFNNSKILDNDKKPLIVYHGTNQNITQFDINKCTPYNLYGKGFYFTDSKEIANAYLGGVLNKKNDNSNIIPSYLMMENPYFLNKKITIKEINEIKKIVKNNEYDFWFKYIYDDLKNIDDFPWDDCSYNFINKKDIENMVNYLVDNGKLDKTDYLTREQVYFIISDSISSKEILKQYFISKGYDGIILNTNGTGLSNNPMNNINHNIYVVFEPNQIKHALKNKNFNLNNNSIYEMKYMNNFSKFLFLN